VLWSADGSGVPRRGESVRGPMGRTLARGGLERPEDDRRVGRVSGDDRPVVERLRAEGLALRSGCEDGGDTRQQGCPRAGRPERGDALRKSVSKPAESRTGIRALTV
jgi:hypothetical protein